MNWEWHWPLMRQDADWLDALIYYPSLVYILWVSYLFLKKKD